MAAPLLKTCCRSDDAAVPPSVLVVSVVVVFALQFTVPVGLTIHAAFAVRGTATATAAPTNAASIDQRSRRLDIPKTPNVWPAQATAVDSTDTGVERAQLLVAAPTAFEPRTPSLRIGPTILSPRGERLARTFCNCPAFSSASIQPATAGDCTLPVPRSFKQKRRCA